MNRRDALKLFGGVAIAAAVLPSIKVDKAANSILKKRDKLQYKLGKLPANRGYGLRLADYIPNKLPPLPHGDFGHQGYVRDWKMLGNGPDPSNPPYIPEGVGDCAIAGPYHAEMLWNAVSGKRINVDTETVIKTYSEVTGYIPGDQSTDRGSNVDMVSNYWHTHGLPDADGKLHKIDAWAHLTPGNIEELLYAIYLFGAVGIGVQFPIEWMQAMNAGRPWDVLQDPSVEGGHYVLGVASVHGLIDVITWGQEQLMTYDGYREFCDEAVVYVSRERLLASGKDLNGFNIDQLMADFAALPKL